MKLFTRRGKNFKKIKTLSKINKVRRKKILESIEINKNIISFFKIAFFLCLIYYDISIFRKMKTSPVRKVSDETFKEILSFIDEHKNISLEEVDEFRQYSRDKKFIEQNPIVQGIILQKHLMNIKKKIQELFY